MTEHAVRDNLDTAATALLKVRGRIAEAERIMGQLLPGVAAMAYDTDRGGSLLWCELHERRLAECQQVARKADVVCPCEGVPLPRVVDPAGDAACADEVLADAREAVRRARRLVGDAAWFVGLVKRYSDTDRLPDEGAELAADNAPKCERHLRYGYSVRAHRKQPTKVKHKGVEILVVALRLCRWCEDDVRDRYIDSEGRERRLPTESEVRRHAEKARLQAA